MQKFSNAIVALLMGVDALRIQSHSQVSDDLDVCVYGDPSACTTQWPTGGDARDLSADELVGALGLSCATPGGCAEGYFYLWTANQGETSYVCIPDECFAGDNVCTYGDNYACNENPGGFNDCVSPVQNQQCLDGYTVTQSLSGVFRPDYTSNVYTCMPDECFMPDGVEVLSVYHCDGDCRNGDGEPTEGRYAFFDCAEAEEFYGGDLETNSFHTVLVNGEDEYEIILWTEADTWNAADGTADCAARKRPADDAVEGDWAVGDTFVFLSDPEDDGSVGIISSVGRYAYFDCADATAAELSNEGNNAAN